MLSIVFCGRNDNHNGDFDKRAIWAQSYNAKKCQDWNIEVEFIYVEWNPLPGKPYFSETLKEILPNLRTYVVPEEIHNDMCDNPKMGMLQFFAKNVGARRAKYENLIITNADTYLTDDVFARVRDKVVNDKTLYLYERVNVSSEILNKEFTEELLTDPENIVFVSTPDIPKYFGAAGDLMLMKTKYFDELEGYSEHIRFSTPHIDTIFCKQVLDLKGNIEVDGKVYHIDHEDSWANKKDNHSGGNYSYQRHPVPYANKENWGLLNAQEKKVEQAIILTLEGPLRQTLPLERLVPDQFKIDEDFQKTLIQTLHFMRSFESKILIYGFGADMWSSHYTGQLQKMNIIGIVEESCRHIAYFGEKQFPYPLLKIKDIKNEDFDGIVVGSSNNLDLLTTKAIKIWGDGKVFPQLKNSLLNQYYSQVYPNKYNKIVKNFISAHITHLWKYISILHPRIALFGGGQHTTWLLSLLKGKNLSLPIVIFDDASKLTEIEGIEVSKINNYEHSSVDVVILSTETWQETFTKRIHEEWGKGTVIVNLYEDIEFEPFDKDAVQ